MKAIAPGFARPCACEVLLDIDPGQRAAAPTRHENGCWRECLHGGCRRRNVEGSDFFGHAGLTRLTGLGKGTDFRQEEHEKHESTETELILRHFFDFAQNDVLPPTALLSNKGSG